MGQEKILYKDHPAMFRNRPTGFILCVILIPAFGVGAVVLLCWWLKSISETLTVSNERTTHRTGLLSKHTTEVWHRDVRNVRIDQRFLQRILGVGTVRISSSGQSGFEIESTGCRFPARIKEIIDAGRR